MIKIKTIQIKKNPKKHGKHAHWSDSQRQDAVVKYLVLGNICEVGRQTNIPEDTLRKWKASQWWKDMEKEVREESARNLSGKIGTLLHKSIDVMNDRLEKGDFIYNPKTGSVTRMGVKASVANQITKDMIDRQIVLDRIASSKTVNEQSIADRLDALKASFEKFAKDNTKVIKEVPASETIIDVTNTDSKS